MIRIGIIDDEKHALATLKWKLSNCDFPIEIVFAVNSALQGLEEVKNQQIDLLFLDIEMPTYSGFDLLSKLDQITFDVVFTTAYDEYGIKAIKYSALDYLLKPIQEEELTAALQKHVDKSSVPIHPRQFELLWKNLQTQHNLPKKIALSNQESIELVEPKRIILCESDNNYTYVYVEGKKRKLISRPLKEFQDLLSDFSFFRSHQSFLVNTEHIVEYKKLDGGYLIMSNDMKIPVSRSRKEELMKIFNR